MDAFALGRDFVHREARLLERRLFAVLFEGASADGVVDALRGYRNADGGFGHGLEPDKRAPDSQPLDVAFALETLVEAGARADGLALAACDFLSSVADERGAVPIVLESVARYPRAEHWGDGRFPPSVNPTADLVAHLERLGVDHPWRRRAARYVAKQVADRLPADAHAIRSVLPFLQAGDAPRVREALSSASFFRADPDDPAYGLTPLDFAPEPASPWRVLFADDDLDAHLDRLARDQQADGGWPLTWTPPGEAAALEWRGRLTVTALRVLTAYGRA